MTSPECLLFPGQVGLCEPVPAGGGVGGGDSIKEAEERMVVKYLTEQHFCEQSYIREAFTLPRYSIPSYESHNIFHGVSTNIKSGAGVYLEKIVFRLYWSTVYMYVVFSYLHMYVYAH